jgi:hypothetical protein
MQLYNEALRLEAETAMWGGEWAVLSDQYSVVSIQYSVGAGDGR